MQKPITPTPPVTSGLSRRASSAATQSSMPLAKSNLAIMPSESFKPCSSWPDSQLRWMRQNTSGAPTT